MKTHASVAVIGLGAMGSMTAWRLAQRGVDVLGIERHRPGHAFGSSHGDTRLIRTATRGPDYVRWAVDSFPLWRELEERSGARLLTQTGALLIGHPLGDLVTAGLARSREHGLRCELIHSGAMARRYPQHVLALEEMAVREELAGMLRPEASIAAASEVAERRGATLLVDTHVSSLTATGTGVAVETSRGTFTADRAVVAVGARTLKLLPQLPLDLEVERQVLAWFQADGTGAYAADRFPVFTHELPGPRYVYGFPSTDGLTIKLAVHHGGRTGDPDAVDPEIHPSDLAPIQEFAQSHLRGVGRVARAAVCMYTNAPRGLFYATTLPALPGVTVVNACNGDGFKFAAIVGEALAAHIAEGAGIPAGLLSPNPAPASV